jgi:glycosyltransferase involved in cell wall biosynthesis
MEINKITYVIPCYNQSQYLDECLQSVLDQTYRNWECIIVNDGSSDDTEQVAKKWLIGDNRFKYVYQENGGLSSARNLGVKQAVGEFILPLDADDRISKSYASLAIESFNENKFLKVVYCLSEKFGIENGPWLLNEFSLEELAKRNMIFCSAFFRKKDWELVGGYDENMKYGLEDWEFWIAILKNGGAVKCLEEVGFYYRIKLNSMIAELDLEKRKYLFDYMSVKHADFFVQQFGNSLLLYRENVELKKFHSKVVSSFLYKTYKFPLFLYTKLNKLLK